MAKDNLYSYLSENNLSFDAKTLITLREYMLEILEANKHINLTAIQDETEFIENHLIDSLEGATLDEFKEAKKVIDIGTGGGFPGIPLAIEQPNKEFILVDSVQKKLKVVSAIADKLKIKNIKTIHARAETLAKEDDYREQFDICVSRAVANLSTLCEYCLPLVKVGGHFFAYKAKQAKQEIMDGERALTLLGGRLKYVSKTQRIHREKCIIVIEKIKETPLKYPRKPGIPSKKPL